MKMRLSVGLMAAVAVVVGALVTTAQNQQPVQGSVIVKSTQQGVSNVKVTYERADQPLRETVTNASGGFTFDSRELGTVAVSHSNYAKAYRRWPPMAGNRVTIEMEPAVAVSGSLRDSVTLEPLAGDVTVVVRQPPHQVVSRTVEVEADGDFTVEDLPSGSATLVAAADGYAAVATKFTVAAGASWTEHMRLPAAAALQGEVQDANGTLVEGAQVMAEYANDDGDGYLTASIGGLLTTNEDGEFVLTDLRPSQTLLVWAEQDGQSTGVESVFVDPVNTNREIVLRFANQ